MSWPGERRWKILRSACEGAEMGMAREALARWQWSWQLVGGGTRGYSGEWLKRKQEERERVMDNTWCGFVWDGSVKGDFVVAWGNGQVLLAVEGMGWFCFLGCGMSAQGERWWEIGMAIEISLGWSEMGLARGSGTVPVELGRWWKVGVVLGAAEVTELVKTRG